MKTGIIFLVVIVLGVAAIVFFNRNTDAPAVNETNTNLTNLQTYQECSTDADCSRAGCSGQICTTAARASGVVTDCAFREEYACYQQTNCACISGFCRWDQTDAFQFCLDGLQKTNQ